MSVFTPSEPEKEQVSLTLSDTQLEITQFTEYSFNSNFLTPTDGFSFTVGAERLSLDMQDALIPGAAVKLSLNGRTQATGYIDSIEKTASRGGGTEWRIEGRDRLGQVVDACADPTQSLKESMTLIDALKKLFGPFGWSEEDNFDDSNENSILIKTGLRQRAKRRTSDAKGFGRKALKAFKLHQYRPYSKEGVFEFASRITQRLGLWLWLSPDGETVIVSEPDFDSVAPYTLIRNDRGDTNVLEGSVKFDLTEQPTIIIADAYSQGGEFGKSQIRAISVNTAVYTDDPEYINTFTRFPTAKLLPVKPVVNNNDGTVTFPGHSFATPMKVPRNKVLYLHDDESQTLENLERFVEREMALLQRRSLTANYTVEGHGQNTPDGFVPWTVDTTIDVDDEVAGVKETMYVLGRTFNKSRSGGTTTQLELIRCNTMVFTSTGK